MSRASVVSKKNGSGDESGNNTNPMIQRKEVVSNIYINVGSPVPQHALALFKPPPHHSGSFVDTPKQSDDSRNSQTP